MAAGESEQLFTGNQNGRVCCYTSDSDFNAREILRLQFTEGNTYVFNILNFFQSF